MKFIAFIIILNLIIACTFLNKTNNTNRKNYEVFLDIKIDTTFYLLRGITKNEIINNISFMGITIDNKKYGYSIMWQFNWNELIRYSRTMDCDIDKARLSLSINYTLPELIMFNSIDSELKTEWINYKKKVGIKLKVQESIIIKYGNEMAFMISDLSSLECSEFLDTIEKNAIIINSNCQQEINQYQEKNSLTF